MTQQKNAETEMEVWNKKKRFKTAFLSSSQLKNRPNKFELYLKTEFLFYFERTNRTNKFESLSLTL